MAYAASLHSLVKAGIRIKFERVSLIRERLMKKGKKRMWM